MKRDIQRSFKAEINRGRVHSMEGPFYACMTHAATLHPATRLVKTRRYWRNPPVDRPIPGQRGTAQNPQRPAFRSLLPCFCSAGLNGRSIGCIYELLVLSVLRWLCFALEERHRKRTIASTFFLKDREPLLTTVEWQNVLVEEITHL